MTQTHKQDGVALITALLVVSLATVLAVSLVSHLYYDIRRTENILRLDQAQLYNSNAVEFAMILLKLDRDANNEFDSLGDLHQFNEQAAIFPVEGGSVSAKLADLQSCFNLNNLSKSNKDLAIYRQQYITLLGNLEVEANLHTALADSLIDWLDDDDQNETQGAEFDYYIGLDKPYRTANALMVSPSELRLVKGYTVEVIDLIKDEICVLPNVNTGININTASSIMLNSLENLKGHGEQIVKDRDGTGEKDNIEDDSPFEQIDDFTKYAIDTLKISKYKPEGIQVYSEYFLLKSQTQLGAGNVKLFSMIYRDQSNAKTELIRQTSGDF